MTDVGEASNEGSPLTVVLIAGSPSEMVQAWLEPVERVVGPWNGWL
jgi:hypothetical protein